MQHDLPLRVRGTTPAGQDSQHTWGSALFRWDLYFAAVLVATLGCVAASGGPLPQRASAAGCLLAAAGCYAALGRGELKKGQGTRRGACYIVCLAVLVVVAQTQDAAASWVLFAANPQCLMALPVRRAVVAVAALGAVPLLRLGLAPHRNLALFGAVGLGILFSLVVGTWVSNIMAQSRERTELIGRLRDAQADVARLSHDAGVLAERQRLASEIHDTLAQALTSIVMLLQAANAAVEHDPGEARRTIGLAAASAREGLAEARAMVTELTPAPLGQGPLPDALRRVADRTAAELGVAVDVEMRGAARPLPATAEVVLLRCAQEAFANVRKHARATRVGVVLAYADRGVRLDVTDDGVGFTEGRGGHGYGLQGMRDRIVQAGGSLVVRSRPGEGTSLTVELPQ